MDPDTPTRPMGVMEEYYRENSHYWVRESAMRHILDAAVKRREAQIQIEAGNDSYHATPYLIVVPSGDLRRQYFCLTEIYPQLDVVVFDPCGHVHFWDDAPFVLVSWEKCVESIQRWIANSDIAEVCIPSRSLFDVRMPADLRITDCQHVGHDGQSRFYAFSVWYFRNAETRPDATGERIQIVHGRRRLTS